MPFSKLGLSTKMIKKLLEQEYTQATPIQEKVIPLVFEGKDIQAKAQTGSGKSASFVLPILELVSAKKSEGKAKIKALVLTPTRELTQQVSETFMLFNKGLDKKLKIVSIIGGTQLGEQMTAIQKGCDIVVATSGRLLEIIEKQQINLNKVEFFVLDEADKMLDLGFADELETLLKELPDKRQNLLFSATYPEKMLNLASQITSSAIEVSIEETPVVQSITQRVIEVNKENRGPLLRHLLEQEKWEQVLIFMANKRATDNIAAKFRKYGIKADSFHGDLSQEEREYTLKAYKDKKFPVLFTTDIASRGLDINNITCVINFDLPRSPADYIHRIGRTGRAGKSGLAISFIDHEDQAHFKLIEKRSNIRLEREQIEGYELQGEAPKKVKGPAPVKGKGKSKKDKLREKAAKASKQ